MKKIVRFVSPLVISQNIGPRFVTSRCNASFRADSGASRHCSDLEWWTVRLGSRRSTTVAGVQQLRFILYLFVWRFLPPFLRSVG